MYWFAEKRVNYLTNFKNSQSIIGPAGSSGSARPVGLIAITTRLVLALSLYLCLPAAVFAQSDGEAYGQDKLASSYSDTGNRDGRNVPVYANTEGSPKAAQLYQDARYDYSMGYLSSAINNLKQLIATYPVSPFAVQGRRDLKMLYAQVRRARATAARAQTRKLPGRTSARRVSSRGGQGDRSGEQDKFGVQIEFRNVTAGSSIAARYTPAAELLSEEDSLSPMFGKASGNSERPIITPVITPVTNKDRLSTDATADAQAFAGGAQLHGRAIDDDGQKDDGSSRQSIASWSHKIMTLGLPPPEGKAQVEILQKGQPSIQIPIFQMAQPIRTLPPAQLRQPATRAALRSALRDKQKAASFRRYNAAFKLASSDRVFFGSQSAGLGGRARSVIAAQARWLKSHDDLIVAIDGHADEGGSRRADKDMSRRRAEAVRDYLVANGVQADHIIVRANGRAARISICAASYCAAQNRRVVTTIKAP